MRYKGVLISLTPEYHEAVKRLARERQTTVSALIRSALEREFGTSGLSLPHKALPPLRDATDGPVARP